MQLNGQSNVRPPSHKWPELDDNNPYPRMAFYSKNFLNANVKYDRRYARSNMGSTVDFMHNWSSIMAGGWYQKNGVHKNTTMFKKVFYIAATVLIAHWFIDELDKKFALTGAAPKVYPFDQLYLEQGGRQDIPRDQRYIIDNLYDAQPYSSLHQ